MAKIKLTATETVQVWNYLNDAYDLKKQDPIFTGWFKRLMTYMKPEIEIWNSLTIEERKANSDIQLSYPVDKIKAEHLPEVITKNEVEVLQKIAEGDIKVYESQLSKKLKKD